MAEAVYKSKDGTTYKTAEEAERWDRFVDARRSLAEAVDHAGRCLGETALTADGQPYDAHGWGHYWRIIKHFGDFPQLIGVSIYPLNITIDTESEGAPLCVRQYRPSDRRIDGGDYISIPINELYFSKEKATIAWIAACRKYAAQVQSELGRILAKERVGTEPVRGLYRRYIISKSDGEPVDPGAFYLVLRLDKGGRDEKWTAACRRAAERLSRSLIDANHLPQVAQDVLDLLAQIESGEFA